MRNATSANAHNRTLAAGRRRKSANAHFQSFRAGKRIPDCGPRQSGYDRTMRPHTIPSIMLPLALAGCGEPMQTLGCFSSGRALVIVSGNNPSALDGYDYQICTARMDSPKCGKYNKITVERPAGITVSLTGEIAHIDQAGGSVFDYSTDPAGMRDASYNRSVPLELRFVTKSSAGFSAPIYQVDGKTVQLQRCPVS